MAVKHQGRTMKISIKKQEKYEAAGLDPRLARFLATKSNLNPECTLLANSDEDLLEVALESFIENKALRVRMRNESQNCDCVVVIDHTGEFHKFPNCEWQIKAMISQREATSAIDSLLAAHGM